MKRFKLGYRLPAVLLALLSLVTVIPVGTGGIKPAEASIAGVVTPIKEVDMVDDNGLPLRTGDMVTIEGIVTIGTGVLHTDAKQTMIFGQDATGGICIFDFEIEVSVKQGDKIRVTGAVNHFRGLTQLQNPIIEIVSSNNEPPTPQQINLAALATFTTAEPLEGELVKALVRIAYVPTRPLGGAYNVGITNVNDNYPLTLRVYPGTGICMKGLRAGAVYTVTGVVGQRDLSHPYHHGYRLFPRTQVDLKVEREGALSPENTVFPTTNTVKRIVDGDTVILETPVIVNGQEISEVRLSGIDAPEAWRREEAHHNQRVHGQRARGHLRNMLPPGAEITLSVCQVKTCVKLRRLLAHIKKGNLNINEAMLRQGHAVTYVVWPNNMEGGRFEALRSAMVEARQNERGLWNPADLLEEIPLKYRERKFGWAPEEYVGDFDTKTYVKFKDMEKVARENRVFFFSYAEVISAGFTSKE